MGNRLLVANVLNMTTLRYSEVLERIKFLTTFHFQGEDDDDDED